jgi:hypothetical protein
MIDIKRNLSKIEKNPPQTNLSHSQNYNHKYLNIIQGISPCIKQQKDKILSITKIQSYYSYHFEIQGTLNFFPHSIGGRFSV